MINIDIGKELDELQTAAVRCVNYGWGQTLAEKADAIRQAKQWLSNKTQILVEMSNKDFGEHNRVRDFFVKDYDFFTSNNITKDWMYDFLNLKKKTSDILKVGKYIKCGDICDTLDELNTKRLYGIKPRGDIGSGEYLIRLLFSLVDEVSDPIPFANGKVCGDMVFRDKVYEMKGQWGRLDGVDNNKIAEIIRQHEELNVRKQVTVGSKTNKELVKDLLRCYFNGDNPYTIINVDTHGYVIIDETLEWDDDIDVRVRIPKWMIEKTFNKEIKDGGQKKRYNDNQRTIMLGFTLNKPKIRRGKKK